MLSDTEILHSLAKEINEWTPTEDDALGRAYKESLLRCIKARLPGPPPAAKMPPGAVSPFSPLFKMDGKRYRIANGFCMDCNTTVPISRFRCNICHSKMIIERENKKLTNSSKEIDIAWYL